jgi:hypothetical protein
MSITSSSSQDYQRGYLPSKIQQFIEATSETNAYRLRPHSHHSLLNAYRVATWLEEASQSVQALKRDAGLRDLAQRLHLWPGDMATELQRDALRAVILLENYIRDGLATEIQYVLGLSGNEVRDEENRDRVVNMTKAKDEALSRLDALVETVRQNTTTQHLTSTDLELNDLCPFIPGFTTAQTKSPKIREAKASPTSSWSASSHPLTASTSNCANVALSQDRLQALAAVELFKDKVNLVVDDFSEALQNNSLDNLKRKAESLSDILDSFELMGSTVSNLIQIDEHEGGVDNEQI